MGEAVVILGMHRSGTSLTSHIVSKLGYELPNNLMGADYGNSLGHFESKVITKTNDNFLSERSLSWDHNGLFEQITLTKEERHKLDNLLRAEYSEKDKIVLKDPRICFFKDEYINSLEKLGYAVKIIIPIRHPKSVVNSLLKRIKFRTQITTEIQCLNLWFNYNINAFKETTCSQFYYFIDDLVTSKQPLIDLTKFLSFEDIVHESLNPFEPKIYTGSDHDINPIFGFEEIDQLKSISDLWNNNRNKFIKYFCSQRNNSKIKSLHQQISEEAFKIGHEINQKILVGHEKISETTNYLVGRTVAMSLLVNNHSKTIASITSEIKNIAFEANSQSNNIFDTLDDKIKSVALEANSHSNNIFDTLDDKIKSVALEANSHSNNIFDTLDDKIKSVTLEANSHSNNIFDTLDDKIKSVALEANSHSNNIFDTLDDKIKSVALEANSHSNNIFDTLDDKIKSVTLEANSHSNNIFDTLDDKIKSVALEANSHSNNIFDTLDDKIKSVALEANSHSNNIFDTLDDKIKSVALELNTESKNERNIINRNLTNAARETRKALRNSENLIVTMQHELNYLHSENKRMAINAEADKLPNYKSLSHFFDNAERRSLFGIPNMDVLNSIEIVKKNSHLEAYMTIEKNLNLSDLVVPLEVENKKNRTNEVILLKFSKDYDRFDLKQHDQLVGGINRIYLTNEYKISSKHNMFFKLKKRTIKKYITSVKLQTMKRQRPLFKRSIKKLDLKVDTICIDHTFGGGSNKFRNQKLYNHNYILFSYDTNEGAFVSEIVLEGNESYSKVSFTSYHELIEQILYFIRSKDQKLNLFVNSFAGFPNTLELVGDLTNIIKQHAEKFCSIKFFFHDFHSLCTSEKLINNHNKFCNIPNISDCKTCFKSGPASIYSHTNTSVDHWRRIYLEFLKLCSDVIFFSKNSLKYVEAYNSDIIRHCNIAIEPHKGHQLPTNCKRTSGKNIAVLGTITYAKGSSLFDELVNKFSENKEGIKFYSIGKYFGKAKKIIELSTYNIEDLTQIVEDNDIGTILLLSIWPETYAYVADEAAELRVNVICTKYGAAFERYKGNPNFTFIKPNLANLIRAIKYEL